MRLDRGVAGVGTIAAAAAGGQLVEIAAAVLAQLSPPQLAARRSPNYAGQPECSVRRPRFSRRRCISSISVGQFGNVWTHDYTVIVDENGSFSGTGSVSDNGAAVATWTEQDHLHVPTRQDGL